MPDEEIAQHAAYMRRCIELARVAAQQGNIAVGAVIVEGGKVIAEAGEQLPNGLDVTGHAEILAIREACRVLNTLDLRRCTLYSSAEPCWMCSYAIREARIRQVVIGSPTNEVGGITSKYPLLTDATISGWAPPPIIITGVLVEEYGDARSKGRS
jgi:tRNA(adenine34) deaminase